MVPILSPVYNFLETLISYGEHLLVSCSTLKLVIPELVPCEFTSTNLSLYARLDVCFQGDKISCRRLLGCDAV
jgi:hypothetical protein